MNLKKCARGFLSAAAVTMVLGCATMFANKNPEVSVWSNPAGAEVYVNGEFAGNTPMRFHLAANKSYTIEFLKEGFEPKAYRLNNHAGGSWIIMDVFLGFWPVIVDMATGAHYELDTTDVGASLVARADQAAGNTSNPWSSGSGQRKDTQGASEVISVTTKEGNDHRGRIIIDRPNDFLSMQLLDGSIVKIRYREIDRRGTVSLIEPPAPPHVIAIPRGETPSEPLYVFQGKSFPPSSYDLLVNCLESERPGDADLKILAAQYKTEKQQQASLRAAKPFLGIASIVVGAVILASSLSAANPGESPAGESPGPSPLALVFWGLGIGVMVAPSPSLPAPDDIVSYYNMYD